MISSLRAFLTSVLLCTAVATVTAGPLTLDLGQGLTYFRAHVLPSELPPSSPTKPQPLVLDLRYATGDEDAAFALAAWIKFHAASRTPVLLLANAATSPALRAAFANRDHTAGLIVLGVASPAFEPDVALVVDAETEHRAYDALESGTALSTLIAPPIEKIRNDEARLVAQRLPERAPANEDSEPPVPPNTPVVSVATATPSTPPPPPVIDVVLQRAVQLHRALLALKKL